MWADCESDRCQPGGATAHTVKVLVMPDGREQSWETTVSTNALRTDSAISTRSSWDVGGRPIRRIINP
jgi:hypothetical protein